MKNVGISNKLMGTNILVNRRRINANKKNVSVFLKLVVRYIEMIVI